MHACWMTGALCFPLLNSHNKPLRKVFLTSVSAPECLAYKRGTDLSSRVGPQESSHQRPGKSRKKMTEISRAKGTEESIPKKSKEIGMEEQTLYICPRKEVPENDSEDRLKR